MRIKEFSIIRYGPLPNTGRILLDNFNLFFGKNEDGKTLTIDALVKLLLGRNIKDFERIDRVGENPEGYVIVEDDNGKETKLSEKVNITKVVDLTPSECRNIFIIRNSDLSIARENEFYTNVTDRLTGLRTQEITSIKKKLQELGKLTRPDSQADLSDKLEFGKIKAKVNNARSLMEEIDKLQDKIKENRFDVLEEELVRCGTEIESTKQQLESFEDASKREKYEKGRGALDKLKGALEKSEDLRDYNEDDRELWRDNEKALQEYNEEKQKLAVELREAEQEFKKAAEKLKEKEQDFQVIDQNRKVIEEVEREIKEFIALTSTYLENKQKIVEIEKSTSVIEQDFEILSKRKEEIDKQIEPELKTYEIKSGELALQEEKAKSFTLVEKISAILLGISLLGAILRPSWLFYIFAGLFFFLVVVSWIFKFQFGREKAWLAGVFKRIKLTCSKFELEAETIEGIRSNVQKFEEKLWQKEQERDRIREKKNAIESQFNFVDNKLKECTNKIAEASGMFGWGKKNTDEYLAHIKDFKEESLKKSKELEDSRIERERLASKIREFKENRIPEKERMIKKATEKIDNVKRKSGEDSLQDYTTKLKSKQDWERSIDQQQSILNGLFGERNAAIKENIQYWGEEIVSLEDYKDKAKDIKYDEDLVSRLKEQQEDLVEKMNELTSNMSIIREEMGNVERGANEILPSGEERFYCQTSVDLKAVKDRLQEFADENEGNKDNTLEVMKIFEKIEMEEKEKVSELFGKESSISKYFNGITNGLYEEVLFNQEPGKLQVKQVTRKEEVILDAEKLSGGAYDQLYLSIRLALGEKLLKGNKGFFIMDDPLVKADEYRLQRQIQTLKKISESGWQVVYFSAKGEIKDALKEDIDNGVVKCVEVQSIFS